MGDLEEEEFILLDLDGVCNLREIVPNMSYLLSGLDTMNPVMVLDGKIKLVGENIGTCFVFSDNDTQKEMEHSVSDANNSLKGRNGSGNEAFEKQVKPIAQLQKILKFKLFHEVNTQIAEVEAHESRPTLVSESEESIPLSGAKR